MKDEYYPVTSTVVVRTEKGRYQFTATFSEVSTRSETKHLNGPPTEKTEFDIEITHFPHSMSPSNDRTYVQSRSGKLFLHFHDDDTTIWKAFKSFSDWCLHFVTITLAPFDEASAAAACVEKEERNV